MQSQHASNRMAAYSTPVILSLLLLGLVVLVAVFGDKALARTAAETLVRALPLETMDLLQNMVFSPAVLTTASACANSVSRSGPGWMAASTSGRRDDAGARGPRAWTTSTSAPSRWRTPATSTATRSRNAAAVSGFPPPPEATRRRGRGVAGLAAERWR